jgi:hypothetical protein
MSYELWRAKGNGQRANRKAVCRSAEAVSKVLFRHCELRGMKQEAIHKSFLMNRIASVFDLAMTVKPARRRLCLRRAEHATSLQFKN